MEVIPDRIAKSRDGNITVLNVDLELSKGSLVRCKRLILSDIMYMASDVVEIRYRMKDLWFRCPMHVPTHGQ